MEPCVFGFVHDTHPTPAEFFKDAVVGNSLADERAGLRHGAAILAPATCGSPKRVPTKNSVSRGSLPSEATMLLALSTSSPRCWNLPTETRSMRLLQSTLASGFSPLDNY